MQKCDFSIFLSCQQCLNKNKPSKKEFKNEELQTDNRREKTVKSASLFGTTVPMMPQGRKQEVDNELFN